MKVYSAGVRLPSNVRQVVINLIHGALDPSLLLLADSLARRKRLISENISDDALQAKRSQKTGCPRKTWEGGKDSSPRRLHIHPTKSQTGLNGTDSVSKRHLPVGLLEDQILTVPKLWTASLCKRYVNFLSTLPLSTTPGKPKKGEAVRVNDRYQIDDADFAARLWSDTALKQIVESPVIDGRALSVDERDGFVVAKSSD